MLHTCRSNRGANFCMQLCKRDVPDMGSEVNMHKFTDACTYSNQSYF